MSKLPAFQFYPGDWMKDPSLRSVSFAARGLWVDMLCLMFEGGFKRGFMCHPNGKAITTPQLCRIVGGSAEEILPLLDELEATGVFSKTENGVIFSRRMVRDEERRKLLSDAGKRGGGNPKLRGENKPLNPPLKGGLKTKVKPSPPPSASASPSGIKTPLPPSGDLVRERLCRIFRMNPNRPFNDVLQTAYRKAQPIEPQELEIVEWFYSIPTDEKEPLLKWRRTSLLVLLRNWNDAVGKANLYAEGKGRWDWKEHEDRRAKEQVPPFPISPQQEEAA
jgi:hypothetical protein